MDVVSLVHQADEGTAHGNHVVVRMGRENEHLFGERGRLDRTGVVVDGAGLATRPAGNRMLEVVENLDVDGAVGPELVQQFAQGIFQIILVGQFQDGLVHLLAQPHHGLADEFGRPFTGAYQPGRDHPGEHRGCRLVGIEPDIVMILEQGCRDGGRGRTLHDVADHRSLRFAPCHEDDLLGRHHGADAQRDGLFGRVGDIAVEVLGLALAGLIGQHHHAGMTAGRRAGLVETHLTICTDTDYQQVDMAGQGVEAGAVFGNLVRRNGSVRDVDVLLGDVHQVQERIVQQAVAALGRIGRRGVVFID